MRGALSCAAVSPPARHRWLQGSSIHTVFFVLNITSCGGVVPMELMHPFFRVGLGLPMGQAVRGSRHIVFGSLTDRDMRTSVGVLMAWVCAVYVSGGLKIYRYRRELRARGYLLPGGASPPPTAMAEEGLAAGGGRDRGWDNERFTVHWEAAEGLRRGAGGCGSSGGGGGGGDEPVYEAALRGREKVDRS